MISERHPRLGGRTAERDALLIMLAYRHGLRASEVTALRWDQVDLKAGQLHVARLKHGDASTHPLRGPELRALRAWKRKQDQRAPYVFTSLWGGPMTRRTVHYVVAQATKSARIPFSVHPHMLRHGTGFYLTNQGHDTRAVQLYLGHSERLRRALPGRLSAVVGAGVRSDDDVHLHICDHGRARQTSPCRACADSDRVGADTDSSSFAPS